MTPYQARVAASKAAMQSRVIETARDARSKGMGSDEWARKLMGEGQ